MNYNNINRNSLMNCIYSDRQNYPYTQGSENWRNANTQQHLNPSKSKVNVRQSLNKTTQNCSTTNPTILNIRNSCLINTSISAHNPPKDVFLQDKFFKTAKDTQEPLHSTLTPKEHYPRYSQVNNFRGGQERKKSQSAHFRSGSSNQFMFKLDNQFKPFEFDKAEKAEKIEKQQKVVLADSLKDIRDMVNALTKRLVSNEEEIAKIKQRQKWEQNNNKKVNNLQIELNEYKSKLFDLAKFNSKSFIDLEAKIQQNNQIIGQMREKLVNHPQESSKKNNILQAKICELSELTKHQQQNIERRFNSFESHIKKTISEEVTFLKSLLQGNKSQITDLLNKVKRLQCDKSQQFKKSNKKSMSSLIIQSKQTLIIRQSDLFKDKTKQLINYPQSSKRQSIDQIPKRDTLDSQSKRELVIKQKLYYIDTNGFLLDENKYYLLNSKNEQILLSDTLINCLKENNILSGVGFRR